ncbi:MAG: hypothetical protein AAF639_30415 [Chloroflexota bacterium]
MYTQHWETLIERTLAFHCVESATEKPCRHYEFAYPDCPLPVISQGHWSEVVDQLGYDPGPFITALYRVVGGGEVGPGTFPVVQTKTSDFHLIEYNVTWRKEGENDIEHYWPPELLAFVNWGCAIVSCVDCSSPQLPVIRYDPHYSRCLLQRDWRDYFRPETSVDWWQQWMEYVVDWRDDPSMMSNADDWWERWLANEEHWRNHEQDAQYTDELRYDYRKSFRLEAASLYEWWERWLAGENLFNGQHMPVWESSFIPYEKRLQMEGRRGVSEGQLAFNFGVI